MSANYLFMIFIYLDLKRKKIEFINLHSFLSNLKYLDGKYRANENCLLLTFSEINKYNIKRIWHCIFKIISSSTIIIFFLICLNLNVFSSYYVCVKCYMSNQKYWSSHLIEIKFFILLKFLFQFSNKYILFKLSFDIF